MNFKKLISLITALSIILTVLAVPSMAEDIADSPEISDEELISEEIICEEPADIELENTKFKYYVIKDNFDTNLGNWTSGQILDEEKSTFSMDRVTLEDGTTALKMVKSKSTASGRNAGSAVNLLKKPLYFNSENKIVIHARVKQIGNGTTGSSANLLFKINRPDALNQEINAQKGSEIGHDWYTAFNLRESGLYNMKTDLWSAYNSGNGDNLATTNTLNKWYEITMTFSGGEKYSISVTDENNVTKTSTGTIRQASSWKVDTYIPYTYYFYGPDAPAVKAFERFDSFTFLFREHANTTYIDYFEVYEERDYFGAQAEVVNTYIRTTDSIDIKLTGDKEINDVPADAFFVEGYETEISFNDETDTVTLTPKTELPAGTVCNVTVNPDILYEQQGIVLSGETSFTVNVSSVNVTDVAPKGRVIIDSFIEADYVYSAPVPEGEHIYQWQMCDSPTGNFIDIDGATEKKLPVTSLIYGNYVRFVMTPVDADGTAGLSIISSVLSPEKAPVASDVTLSSTTLFPGAYLTATYDFYDENGDEEGNSTIRWYTSDLENGPWTERGEGLVYKIADEDNGKYLKCVVTPASKSQFEVTGANAESAVAGPVRDLIEQTNMYPDAGFENGEYKSPWGFTTKKDWNGPQIQTESPHTGQYGIYLSPRKDVSDNYGYSADYKNGHRYIFSSWARKSKESAPDILTTTLYLGSGTWSEPSKSGQSATYTVSNDWIQLISAKQCGSNTNTRGCFVSWVSMDTADMYMDDLYCGEVMIKDVETYDVPHIEVPESGETSFYITSGKLFNQFGTQHGVDDQTVTVSVPEGKGVYARGNEIVVTEKAVASKILIEISCVPTYVSPAQPKFQKFVEFEIHPNNNTTPQALNVNATGIVKDGATLEGSYEFYQVEGKTDASEIKWMYSDTENGVYNYIPGANSLTYTVESIYADKFIKFVVLPKTSDGLVGSEVRSDVLTCATAPVAKNVSIKGIVKLGATLEGEYEYYDVNKDAEGNTTFAWFISDYEDSGFVPVLGANSKTLTVTEDMAEKYIKFTVTPMSSQEPFSGNVQASEPILGPAAPRALNVQITSDGNRLKGVYTYSHPHNVQEGKTTYQWTVDGVVVSNEIDYVINFSGTKKVTFSVTPVCGEFPREGKTVTVTGTYNGYPSSSGSPGGGGGGGGSFGGGGGGSVAGGSGTGSGVTSVNDLKLPEKENEDKPKDEETTVNSDINGHWGETYIKEMQERGVMKADEKGNFDPDRIVSRSEMITYLFDALKLEETEYTAEFSDVSALDGYAGKLQTMINNGTIASYHEFRPNDGISREEMCKILYISLENAGKLTKAETNVLDVFADKSLISDWATDYVNTIFANKIMIGTSDTTFAPNENITRAQVATMLVRILDVLEKEAE